MQNVLSPLINMYQTQLEVSRKFADAIFSGTEKIDRMIIGATHRVFTDQLNFAQAMATVRDPRNVGNALQSSFMQHTPDEAMNYQKEFMRIFADMQNEIGRSMQDYMTQLGSNAASTATKPLESAQEQTNDAVFNPMTSMFSVWESAFKDVAALAKKNMTAARSTAEDVASRTRQATSNYADVAASSAQHAAEGAANVTGSAVNAGRSTIAMGEEAGSDEKKGSPLTPGSPKRK